MELSKHSCYPRANRFRTKSSTFYPHPHTTTPPHSSNRRPIFATRRRGSPAPIWSLALRPRYGPEGLVCFSSSSFFFLLNGQQPQKTEQKTEQQPSMHPTKQRRKIPVIPTTAPQLMIPALRSSAGLYGSNAHSGVSSAGRWGGRAAGGARRRGAHLIIL